MQLPDGPAFARIRRREIDNDIHAPLKGAIDALAGIRRHDQNAFKRFEPLQQKVSFEIGVPIIGSLHARPPRKQRVAFIEQKDYVQLFSPGKNLIQVLFCFFFL